MNITKGIRKQLQEKGGLGSDWALRHSPNYSFSLPAVLRSSSMYKA